MGLILITGSRDWPHRSIVGAVLRDLEISEKPWLSIVHGDCPTGADRHCREFCEERGLCEFRCPAKWKRLYKAAGPVRNEWMLRLPVDYVMAFHEDIEASKGTKSMLSLALYRKIKCALHDGTKWINPKNLSSLLHRS